MFTYLGAYDIVSSTIATRLPETVTELSRMEPGRRVFFAGHNRIARGFHRVTNAAPFSTALLHGLLQKDNRGHLVSGFSVVYAAASDTQTRPGRIIAPRSPTTRGLERRQRGMLLKRNWHEQSFSGTSRYPMCAGCTCYWNKRRWMTFHRVVTLLDREFRYPRVD